MSRDSAALAEWIRGVAAAALDRGALLVVEDLAFPAPVSVERPWAVIRAPWREDRTPSLKVHMEDGGWCDFGGADADKGGDLVSLWARCRGVSQLDAARCIARLLGLPDLEPARRPAAPTARGSAGQDLSPCYPAPADAPPYRAALVDQSYGKHTGWGSASGWWEYRDAAGALVYVVARWDLPDDHPERAELGRKTYRPLSCCRAPDGSLVWRRRAPPAGARPLYLLPSLAASPTAEVLLVEGEKSADAAARLLGSGWCVTTSHNGAQGAKKHDWSPLAGRRVLIFPDADPPDARGHRPGTDYAASVYAQLLPIAAGVQMVDLDALRLLWPDGALPPRWDLADPLPPGLSPAALVGWLADDAHRRAPPPARKRPRPPPAHPGDRAVVADDAIPEGDGRRHYGQDHLRLIEGIEAYIARREIWPDASDAWRSCETGEILDLDPNDLLTEFLFDYWRRAPCSAGVAGRTIDAVVLQRRRLRRQELIDRILGQPADATAEDEVAAWVESVTGRVDELDCATIRHFVWQVKRRAAGLPVAWDLMLALTGREHGSGKSTAVAKLVSLLEELAIPIRAATLTDDRHAPALSRSLVGIWDEMEGATKANLEALKFTVSANHITYRPLGTNKVVRIQRRMAMIATSNYDLENLIKDTTGNRRFHELRAAARCDWDIINNLDYGRLWRVVSEHDAPPIGPHLERLRDAQASIAHVDVYQRWLEWEAWEELELFTGEATSTSAGATTAASRIIPAYQGALAEVGYTFAELAQRFAFFCRQINHREPSGQERLAQRLPHLGFHLHRPTYQGRRDRRYLLPDAYLPPPSLVPPLSEVLAQDAPAGGADAST